MNEPQRALVTGGNGFIGSHVARELSRQGYAVIVLDIAETAYLDDDGAISGNIEFLRGNLLKPADCIRAVKGVDIVLHFAANMGGMGVIHSDNDSVIYAENHNMTINIFSAAQDAGVRRFFYASSACVYPSSMQGHASSDISLREADAYHGELPSPQGLYGLEKLHSEEYIQLSAPPSMKVYIARFHNIYGPGGSWQDGREKAPAAFLRKCLVAKLSGVLDVEMWGDGAQRRSFCYIRDAVEGVMRLIQSDCNQPVNIGSDRAISMREFIDLAARAVELDPSTLNVISIMDRPTGVASRNSDNTFVEEALGGWTPLISLEDGMRLTGQWIEQQMSTALKRLPQSEREVFLQNWRSSRVLHLTKNTKITFAILLPITSRTSSGHRSTVCINSLSHFADSLRESIDPATSSQLHTRIYLAIDDDDEVLCVPTNPAVRVLQDAGFDDVVTLFCHLPRGRVCTLWRECARRAWEDQCDYYVLMGDDVLLPSEAKRWQTTTHDIFTMLSKTRGVPPGFGCVAFTDVSFPGMPTFPIVHRTHMDIFNGQVVPDVFVNQDGDPYLFQLYRRFGCSVMMQPTIQNTLGGSADARYRKLHVKDWTFGTLDEGTLKLESFLGASITSRTRLLTIDIIIPCYRVNMGYIDNFLKLSAPETVHVMFIIIVDNPTSPNITELQDKYGHRWDVRIRVNKENLGASASRNRGLQESAGEWVLFLDDDVVPQQDIISQLAGSIRANPSAAGFVGNAKFPEADSIFATALHLAGVTYFWDIAEKIGQDVPWGVTANLATSRRFHDGVLFDLSFPKTGGGEDIDYCRKKREFAISCGGTGFVAAPKAMVTHPYWNGGRRSYWRFYMWSKGDGALIKLYPRLTYLDYAPNSAELLILTLSCTPVVALTRRMTGNSPTSPIRLGLWLLSSILLANVIHDAYRHLVRHPERCKAVKTTCHGISWIIAVLESTFIRVFSEIGRTVGLLERCEISSFLRRFDWFAGHPSFGDGPKREERRNSLERFALSLTIFAIGYSCLT